MMKKNNRRISFLLVAALLARVVFLFWVARLTEKQMRDELLVQARIVRHALKNSEIESLTGTSKDLASRQYKHIKSQLASMRRANPDCKFLYLMGQRSDGTVFFLVDSLPETSPDYAPPGLVYDEVPGPVLQAFELEKGIVAGPVTDRWGTLVTAMVPVHNPGTGELVAMLGMDILADDWIMEIVLRSLIPLVIMLLFGAMILITERKRTENQLRESRDRLRKSEERLDLAMSVKNEGMWDWDLKNGTMYYDERYFTMAGYDIDEFPHSHREFEKRVHPEDIGNVREQINKHLHDCYGEFREEFRFKRKNGEWMWILGTAKIVECDDEGNPVRFMGTHTDITERKKAEEEIKNFKKAVDASSDAIGMSTNDGKHYYQNRTFDELFGDVGEDPPSTLYVDEDVGREVFGTILGGDEWIGEVEMFSRDKKILNILLRAYPVKKDGKVMAVVGVHTDITGLKFAEEELKKMDKLKSVGTLAGGIAHDFNNILSGVFGNISIARIHLDKDHPSFAFLEEAERSMERATLLTRQLLTFSRGGDPIKEDVSLERLVKEIVRFDLSGSNVKPVFDIDEDLWMAEVDTGQIQQVFSNLTINADQSMPDGGHLYITLENAEVGGKTIPGLKPAQYIRATIRDEGTGIDKKHIDRIFDPYFTTKQTGSGLGLATVYSIVDRHGGHVSVTSEPGKGTIFVLYLPAHQVERLSDDEESINEHEFLGSSTRILVMDDEEMIRKIASDMLKQHDCRVDTASDGKEALDMYMEAMRSDDPYDLVIMDLTIPGGMGGEEAIKGLLSIDPDAKAIVSSGYSHGTLQARYREYGFRGLVTKPYRMSMLLDVVNRVLEEK